jgi:drug/metabolite transporter (DMT)-like permease
MVSYQLSPYGQAALMALSAYFLFSCADALAKMLSNKYPLALILFIPSCVALLGAVIRIFLSKGIQGFVTSNIKLHMIRGLIMVCFVFLCVSSLRMIPLADFYAIIFLSPFIVMCLSVFLYKEPIFWPRLWVLIVSFVGVVITIGPHFMNLNWGYLAVSIAVMFGALNIMLVRKIGRDEYPPLFGFFPLLCVSLVSLPFALPQILVTDIPQGDMVLFLFYGLALMGAHSLLPTAFARTPSVAKLTPLHYSQMVWGILAGIVIFHEPFQMNVMIGGGLIIGSGIWLFFAERRLTQTLNKK